MRIDKLVDCIETLKKRMDAHREIFESNEAHTRVALIDPLLNALGWDVADPSKVSYEHYVDSARKNKGRADYGLMGLDKHNNDSKPVAILEAKKLGADLDSPKIKVLGYSATVGSIFFGLTDGNIWKLYQEQHGTDLHNKPNVLDITLDSNPSFESALKLLVLWRLNLETGKPVEAGKPILYEPQSELIVPSGSVASTITEPSNWVPISNFDASPNSTPPRFIRFWDGSESPIHHWREILICVVNKLYETENLTVEALPIPFGPNSKRYIVHSKPIHENGNKFKSPKELVGTPLFVEAHGSGSGAVDLSKKLLKRYSIDPITVQLIVE